MPKIILRCNFLSGVPPAQARNYVQYIATRDRTEKVDNAKALLPATAKQKALIENILRDIPGAKGMHEYADYVLNSTRRSASEFITQALEQNLDVVGKRENYVDYISNRPGVEQVGEHGLFTDAGAPVVLSRVQEDAANHDGPIWTHVISLRREDAARLGYDKAEQWVALMRSQRARLAKEMKITGENLRWYAAFHNESHHPHLHLMVYSADPKVGFLTEKGIHNLRSALAHEIFRQDFYHIYDEQKLHRSALKSNAASSLRRQIDVLRTGVCLNPQITADLLLLTERLTKVKGKKQYAFMSKELKAVVDRVVDELARDQRVADAYAEWYRLHCEILKTYKDEMPEVPPLSQQEQFKSIKNMVIAEAMKLGTFQIDIEDAIPEPEGAKSFLPDDDGEFFLFNESEPAMPDERLPEAADEPDEPPPGASESDTSYKIDWNDGYRLARQHLFGSDEVEQDFAEAYRLFTSEALNGNALAMCDLGRMHKDGLGRDINTEAAHTWYARGLAAFLAVEEEKPRAYTEYRIGKLHAAGGGTPQDYAEAAQWFAEAVEENHKYAQYSLAGLYYRGHGVPQDCEEAFELYRRSAEQHNPYASYELAKMLRDGIGTSRDAEEAACHFKEAFKGFVALERRSRDDKLQYRIGQMLRSGTGVDKDEAAAAAYFEKAAKLGNVHAQYALAKIILEAGGGDQERIAEAVEWMTRSAKSGNQYAQYSLGRLYLAGNHVNKDTAKAVYLLTLSAEQENQFAQYQLGKLYLAGEDAPKNIAAAIRWLTASAEQGNQFAQYQLGKLYIMGRDVPRDREQAERWFLLSAAQGNEYAQFFLDHLDEIGVRSPVTAATNLLRALARLFENQADALMAYRAHSESKTLRRERRKKIAQGHASDDQEPRQSQ